MLFQKPYDYRVLLRRFTEDVLVMVDLNQLVRTTTRTLGEILRVEQCDLLLRDPKTGAYHPSASWGRQRTQVRIIQSHGPSTVARMLALAVAMSDAV